MRTSRKILLCSNYAWTVWNFRLPLIRELRAAGHKVYVLTQFDGYQNRLESEVDGVIDLYISRKGLNPFQDFLTFMQIVFELTRGRYDFFLPFTIKPVIYGSLASRLLRVTSIAMITGLGTVFIKKTRITVLVKWLYRFALKRSGRVFFQNEEDKAVFLNAGLARPTQSELVPGSGIDLVKFPQHPFPKSEGFKFLFVGRLLKDKGIVEFVRAAESVKSIHPEVMFQILGPLGVENRTAVTAEELQKWIDSGVIDYLGETDEVMSFMAEAKCIVLPSYREGTSRVLLEAAACGRPIIASNVPGCKEITRSGVNGFLCEARDPMSLKNEMLRMLQLDEQTLKRFGLESRMIVEREYSHTFVTEAYLNVLESLKTN